MVDNTTSTRSRLRARTAQFMAIGLFILYPLSFLIHAMTVYGAHLSIVEVVRKHPTAVTPNAGTIGTYVAFLYLLMLGGCGFVLSSEEKDADTAGMILVAYALITSNFLMVLWTKFWVNEWLLSAAITQGIIVILLLYANYGLHKYRPPRSRRSATLLHGPFRFFVVITVNVLFINNLLVATGLPYDPSKALIGFPYGKHNWHWHDKHIMTAFGYLIAVNVVEFIAIAMHRDWVLCVATTWVSLSLAFAARIPKPFPVTFVAQVFVVLHPLAWIVSAAWRHFSWRQDPESQPLLAESGNGRQSSDSYM